MEKVWPWVLAGLLLLLALFVAFGHAYDVEPSLTYQRALAVVPQQATGRVVLPGVAAGLIPNATKALTALPQARVPQQAEARIVDPLDPIPPIPFYRIFTGQ